MAPALPTYEPRDPSHTVLYTVIADHLETFLASLDADPDATGLPAYVQREFYDYRSYWIPGSYVTSNSMSAPSSALPRLRTLCTNSKKLR
jgi:hypothetical protein